ncbi:MAG: hypothetical protein Q8O10_01500 [candidate division Zixibacteria bacterium]|nr:hypothetical protein [candidate division Zixibacteria bacterium]
MKKLTLFLVVAIFLFSFSCEKKPTGPTTQKPTFTIYGVVVKDLNISKDIAAFTVSRNDTLFNSAIVKVGNKTIPNTISGLYYKEFQDTTFHVKTAYTDSIISPQDTVTITFRFAMPDIFSASINPADSVNENGLAVVVTWTTSDSATAYIISVVKGDTIPGAVLHKAIVTGPLTTIPPDAFRKPNGDVVSGLYWVYMVAYNKSFVSYPDMPFTLPSGLPANNISGAKGTIGAGVIAEKITIRVP